MSRSSLDHISGKTHMLSRNFGCNVSSIELPCPICGIAIMMGLVCQIFFYLLLALFSSRYFYCSIHCDSSWWLIYQVFKLIHAYGTLEMQIIYAHRKSFDVDKFAVIKSIFSSFEKNIATVRSFFSSFLSTVMAVQCFLCFG